MKYGIRLTMDYGIFSPCTIQKDDTSLQLEIFVPPSCDFFCGHFPSFPLLPAVAQVNIVLHFANEAFACGLLAKKMKRVKFANPITPLSKVILKMKYDKDASILSFKIEDKGGVLFASGNIQTKKQEIQEKED